MIACNYDLMPELKSIENIKEISKMLFSAMMGEISRMDENISFIFEDYIFEHFEVCMGIWYGQNL